MKRRVPECVQSDMSEQFAYVRLKFVPKVVTLKVAILRQCEVVVEVSKRLVQLRQSELARENPGEKSIILYLARRAALGTFPEQIPGLYDEEVPTWHEHRPLVVNERPCDHEGNGIRAWRIV
jgi:hypothetical protein